MGDWNPQNETHTSISVALTHAASHLGVAMMDVRWIGTNEVALHGPEILFGACGIWSSPGSPYVSYEALQKLAGCPNPANRVLAVVACPGTAR